MVLRRYFVTILGILVIGTCVFASENNLTPDTTCPVPSHVRRLSGWRRQVNCSCSKLSHWVDTLTDDVIDFHRNIFSVTSIKVVVGTLPLFMGLRPADHMVHEKFYCGRHHKNRHQPPQKVTDFFNYSVPVGLTLIPLYTLFSKDESLNTLGRVFTIAIPFIWFEKNVLKNLICVDATCRPYNQHFPKKKVYGGCPSGHMVWAGFATTLFSLQRGASWGIPLGIYSAALFADFVASNRHFISQTILGTGLGIIYGFAASKTVDYALQLPVTCSLGSTERGYPAVHFSVRY